MVGLKKSTLKELYRKNIQRMAINHYFSIHLPIGVWVNEIKQVFKIKAKAFRC